jgi:UDPglucose 6-dehydrogenase
MMAKPKIGIIGIGAVGTPLKKYFEELQNYERGQDLFLYDADPKKAFQDPIQRADIIFIAVPTPNKVDGSSDISFVQDAVQRAAQKKGKIIVIKSTVPPGTTISFQKKYPNHKFLFNGEYLVEATAWENFINPDHQIVGFTKQSKSDAYQVLELLPQAPLVSPQDEPEPIHITATEAEFIKYANNIYLYRKVILANAICRTCEKLNEIFKEDPDHLPVNFDNVRLGWGADRRVGHNHLDVKHSGYCGVGGKCLPKDIMAFTALARQLQLQKVEKLLQLEIEFNKALLAEQGLTIDDVNS